MALGIIILLAISILPVYLVGLYIYKKDDQKEPPKLLRKLFGFGILICIPAAILEVVLDPLFGAEEYRSLVSWFFYATICIALVEELFKWLVVYNVGFRHKEFDQVYDAIVYAVFVSLGFACFENIFYVLDSGVATGLFRAVTSIPGHAADAIFMGEYIGLAKIAEINHNDKLFKKNIILSILMPTLAHGIYDYCLMTENWFFIGVFFIFLIFLYVYGIKKVKRISAAKEYLYHNPVEPVEVMHTTNNTNLTITNIVNYCPNCGTKSHGNFCTVCGTNLKATNYGAILPESDTTVKQIDSNNTSLNSGNDLTH